MQRLRKRTPKRVGKTARALPGATKGLIVAGVGAVVAAVALLGNRRRRQAVKGAAAEATASVRQSGREYDDVTLARKVESELFRADDAPKDKVSVNAQHGTVELRGEVERQDEIDALGEAAAKVAGVEDVHNLLHTPGAEPGHSPPSTPNEVRSRAKES